MVRVPTNNRTVPTVSSRLYQNQAPELARRIIFQDRPDPVQAVIQGGDQEGELQQREPPAADLGHDPMVVDRLALAEEMVGHEMQQQQDEKDDGGDALQQPGHANPIATFA